MRVYLIRHAPAFERDPKRWPNDRLRPLTPEGVKKFRKAAAGLGCLVDSVACVLTSPLARARQTAEILSAVTRWPPAREIAELAPGHSPEQVLAMMRGMKAQSLALVGHEPGLSELVAASVAGAGARLECELKKGGAACLEFPSAVSAGRARLAWLITPKALRGLG
jgi:phosphohistidine phosphatase